MQSCIFIYHRGTENTEERKINHKKRIIYKSVQNLSYTFTNKYLLPDILLLNSKRESTFLPGIHWVEWEEFKERFGYNNRRVLLMAGLELAMQELQEAGCNIIYIDGSFTSSKPNLRDFDCCWEENGVNAYELKLLAPTIYNFALQRTQQKAKYKGEIFPANYTANETGTLYVDFFQFDTRTDTTKGIIAIDLTRWVL